MKKYGLWFAIFLLVASASQAQSSRLASDDDVRLLKKDVLAGSVKIGKTRLRAVNATYGKPSNVTENETRLTYDYGDLRIVFGKKKYLRKWETDSSQAEVYSRDIDKLRYDLESRQLAGDFVTLELIRKSYGEPTARMVMDGDGEHSVYYYGRIKLIFENVVEVESWRGSGLDSAMATPLAEGGILGAGLTVPPTPEEK